MIARGWIAAGVVGLTVAAAPALAQQPSLGDVARRGEARRARGAKAIRTYSNANLNPSPAAPPAEDQAKKDDGCYESVSQQKCVPAEQVVEKSQAIEQPAENVPQEPVFRQQAQSIRAELERLAYEINTLTAQATNPAFAASKRQVASQSLEMAKGQLERAQRRWARLEKQIVDNKLPHAWIEPVPDNARQQ